MLLTKIVPSQSQNASRLTQQFVGAIVSIVVCIVPGPLVVVATYYMTDCAALRLVAHMRSQAAHNRAATIGQAHTGRICIAKIAVNHEEQRVDSGEALEASGLLAAIGVRATTGRNKLGV